MRADIIGGVSDFQDLIERAILLSVEAHKGQQDRGGRPYVLHPLRVMHKLHNDEERIVALLHDVIEDSPIRVERLRSEGFPETILAAVVALSRNDGESYEDYIRRLACVPLAVRVKKADLHDNMDASRAKNWDPADAERFKRYIWAWNYLADL